MHLKTGNDNLDPDAKITIVRNLVANNQLDNALEELTTTFLRKEAMVIQEQLNKLDEAKLLSGMDANTYAVQRNYVLEEILELIEVFMEKSQSQHTSDSSHKSLFSKKAIAIASSLTGLLIMLLMYFLSNSTVPGSVPKSRWTTQVGEQKHVPNLRRIFPKSSFLLLRREIDDSAGLRLPIEMVNVEGGTFWMGENEDFRLRYAHEVKVSDFRISKYEVTQFQWKAIMGNNPANTPDCDNCPVEQISWNNARQFLKKLNQRFPGMNYRLPTEAEWEFAARGGNKSEGKYFAGSYDIEEVGWFRDNANATTHPVGQKAPNELGIYDLSGNVMEWCQDWHSNTYYRNKEEEGIRYNPVGPSYGSYKVVRGGSWNDYSDFCKVNFRNLYKPSMRSNAIGFRLCRD